MEPRPSDVYLDTSVVVAAAFPGTNLSGPSRRFCQELVTAESRVYFSQILWLEAAQAMRKFATRPDALPAVTRADYHLDAWDGDFLVRQRWMSSAMRQLESFLDQFAEVFEIPFRPRIWRQSVDIMAFERLHAHDAVHLATARDTGVTSFATADHHFRHITQPHIETIRDV
jgi:predicted nucleic acid-binding protein